MKNKSTALAVAKPVAKRRITESEMVDAMVELERRRFLKDREVEDAERLKLNRAMAAEAEQFAARKINTLALDVSHHGDFVEISARIGCKVLPAAMALTRFIQQHPGRAYFDEKKCRETIKEKIQRERVTLILADKTLADGIEAALLKIGAVSV